MPIIIDSTTHQRVLRMENSGDITYNLDINTGSTITMETVPVIGPWIDYTGSNTNINSKNQIMFSAIENQLEGSLPGIKGEKLPRLNIVGQTDDISRRRIIKRYSDGS